MPHGMGYLTKAAFGSPTGPFFSSINQGSRSGVSKFWEPSHGPRAVSGLTPSVRYSKSAFGGRILFQKSYGIGYGVKDPKTLEVGKVYEYKFDVNEIREPIIATVKKTAGNGFR